MIRRIKTIFSGLFILLLTLTMLPQNASAVDNDVKVESDLANISGVVVDATTQQPIANVTVEIEGQQKEATTNREGRFSFENLDSQNVTIKVDHNGYEEFTKEVNAQELGQQGQQNAQQSNQQNQNNGLIIELQPQSDTQTGNQDQYNQ